MTHDPLCVWAQDAPTSANCYVIEGSEPPMTTCEVIAKVRADEKAKVADVLTNYYSEPRPYILELALKMIAHDLGVEIGTP